MHACSTLDLKVCLFFHPRFALFYCTQAYTHDEFTNAHFYIHTAHLRNQCLCAPQFYQPPDRRTQVEQIDDLLDEIANEVEIDSHQPDPATYVEDRLAKLREEQTGRKWREQSECGCVGEGLVCQCVCVVCGCVCLCVCMCLSVCL